MNEQENKEPKKSRQNIYRHRHTHTYIHTNILVHAEIPQKHIISHHNKQKDIEIKNMKCTNKAL